MKIELYIDGEKKTFTAPFVPMLAKRKYLAVMAEIEEEKESEPTTKDIMESDDEFYAILSDIVFQGQFTLEQLYAGASYDYLQDKMREAVFGKKTEDEGEAGK